MRRSIRSLIAKPAALLALVTLSGAGSAMGQPLANEGALSVTVAGHPGHYCDARHHDQHVAMTRIALERGAIEKIGVVDGQATMRVSRERWDAAGAAEWVGIVASASCALAGQGKVVRELTVSDQSGTPMARWDGLRGGFAD